jgi:hypothetical protein
MAAQGQQVDIRQKQLQQYAPYIQGSLKMMESDDPDTMQRGLGLLNQVSQATGFNIDFPTSLPDSSSYTNFARGIQAILADQSPLPQKLQSLTALSTQAKGKRQENAVKTAMTGVREAATANKEAKESDFDLFYKSRKAKGMTDEQISKEWEDTQDRRAEKKIQFGVTVKGAEKEKQEQKIDNMLTPEAVQQEAAMYRVTHQLPATGMSGKGKIAIMNEAAKQAQAEGQAIESRLLSGMAYKAGQAELTKVQSQRGIVMSFANTAEKNLGLVDQLSAKVDRTGIPVLNRWLLAGKRSLAGDPDVSRFDAAVRTAINEYAKVTSSATGGQVTSDQARKEVENMLNTAQTKEQVMGVIQLLRQEMGNRKAGYDKQIGEIKATIGTGAGNMGAQQSPGNSNRDAAIAELQKRGKVVNEDTIAQAMKLLGGQ